VPDCVGNLFVFKLLNCGLVTLRAVLSNYLRWEVFFCPYLVTLFQDLLLEKINRYNRKSALPTLPQGEVHTLVQLILIELSSFTSTGHLVNLGYAIKYGQTIRYTSTGLGGKPTLLGLLFFLFPSIALRENIQDLVPKIFLLFRILGCAATPEFTNLMQCQPRVTPKVNRDLPDL